MKRTTAPGNIGNLYVPENISIMQPPTQITADALNAIQEELANTVTLSGQVLNPADNTQVAKAIQSDALCTSAAVGTADAIIAVGFNPAIAVLTTPIVLYIRAAYANATTTPTLTPASGVIAPATIIKGNNLPLAVGDISGAGHWICVQWDPTWGKWVLQNPATGISSYLSYQPPAGSAFIGFGSAFPARVLQVGLTTINVSRTTYANLFAAIGTLWGAGDGSTTFGLPSIPADYGLIQGAGGVVGSSSVGSLLAHTHSFSQAYNAWTAAAGSTGVFTANTGAVTGSTGGAANLGAGQRVLFGIYY